MKKYIFLYILAIVILAVVITNNYINGDNRLEFKSGDTIPSSIKFISASGEANRIGDVVWDNLIPAEKIKDAGIDSKYNYSLMDKVSLGESKPTAFLTDENNKSC
jgi:hypothetical protein